MLLRDECAVRRKALSAGDALAVFAVSSVLMVIIGVPMQATGLGGVAASEWLLLALPTLLLARARGAGLADSLALKRIGARTATGALLIGASAWYVLVWLVVPLQERIAPTPPELREALEALVPAGMSLPLLILIVALTPAICEELLCRGAIARSLVGAIGPAGAVVVSALLFAMLHLSIYRFVPTLLLGLVLGATALATGSTLTSMIIHLMNNAAIVTVHRYAGSTTVTWASNHGTVVGIMALGMLGIGLWLLRISAPSLRDGPPTPRSESPSREF